MKNDNKLIAEFMGYEIIYRPNSNGFIEISDTELCDVDDLEYHKSWDDWLMTVVEKIESLGYEFTIVENRCKVSKNTVCSLCHHHSVEELFHIETIGSKLDTTYDAVVQFINQYNN